VICGVHYQSDVEAGRMLGASMVAAEHADPAFRADLAAAKAELAKPHVATRMICP
jgi:acid phosphatase (class A)